MPTHKKISKSQDADRMRLTDIVNILLLVKLNRTDATGTIGLDAASPLQC
ncbi:hypothetical protein [Scytonema sp. NUACC21]